MLRVTQFYVISDEKPTLKHVHVFGCPEYVFQLPRRSKFEPCEIEGVYLETMVHGIYKVLVIRDEGILRIVESSHVNFDEYKIPGAPGLSNLMLNENTFI